jgi:predicted transcriptional regulator
MNNLFKNLIDVRASYSPVHVVKILFLLSEKTMGRFQLMRETEMGEATIKTLIKRLKKNKLIESSTKGNVLTKKGNELLKKILTKISKPIKIDMTDYTVGKYNTAILVKNSSKKVRFGVEQRDEAIKIGADGATTLIYSNNRLVFPGCDKKITGLEKTILKYFNVENGDVIVIGSGPTKKISEEASIMIALSLIQKSIAFISKIKF